MAAIVQSTVTFHAFSGFVRRRVPSRHDRDTTCRRMERYAACSRLHDLCVAYRARSRAYLPDDCQSPEQAVQGYRWQETLVSRRYTNCTVYLDGMRTTHSTCTSIRVHAYLSDLNSRIIQKHMCWFLQSPQYPKSELESESSGCGILPEIPKIGIIPSPNSD